MTSTRLQNKKNCTFNLLLPAACCLLPAASCRLSWQRSSFWALPGPGAVPLPCLRVCGTCPPAAVAMAPPTASSDTRSDGGARPGLLCTTVRVPAVVIIIIVMGQIGLLALSTQYKFATFSDSGCTSNLRHALQDEVATGSHDTSGDVEADPDTDTDTTWLEPWEHNVVLTVSNNMKYLFLPPVVAAQFAVKLRMKPYVLLYDLPDDVVDVLSRSVAARAVVMLPLYNVAA